MSETTLQQARQELIAHHLLAYRRPLYQVLALDIHDTRSTLRPSSHDDDVDIKAVFERIWEVLA